jgi:putative hemolysin
MRFAPEFIYSLSPVSAYILARLLKIKPLLAIFRSIPAGLDAQGFAQATLRALQVELSWEEDPASKIPREGPLVIVGNHPLGGLDGVAMLAAVLPFRPDLKLLVNMALGIFGDLRPACLPLDVLSPRAASRNMASLRLAAAHLQQGGAVFLFPSGTVSHWQKGKGIVDPPWQLTAARLAMRHGATVLPVFFQGRNSLLFNMLGVMHPLLRTLLLPREMQKRTGSSLIMKVGRPIEPGTFRLLGSAEAVTSYMRMRCYALGAVAASGQTARSMEPVAEPHAPDQVVRALLSLPEECLLLREGDYAIYVVRASQSSLLMEELGYLREYTFRLVGEGSGKARDLDIYDEQYHHLLLWNEKDLCLAGAYRLGKVQEILAEKGEEGLYTASLFRMNKEFFRRYSDALELGRAVIHPHYQREYSPLMLLWKGIGQFLLRHDEIHCLFGPVSLSLDYTTASLRTVVEYLQEQCGSTELSSMVRGRRLPNRLLRSSAGTPPPDILGYNVLVALVRDIEGGRGLPVLFKHYLKLGGKIGAFHLDTAFNTLDAFLLMDLVDSPRGMLERYMTAEGAARFLARWKGSAESPALSGGRTGLKIPPP